MTHRISATVTKFTRAQGSASAISIQSFDDSGTQPARRRRRSIMRLLMGIASVPMVTGVWMFCNTQFKSGTPASPGHDDALAIAHILSGLFTLAALPLLAWAHPRPPRVAAGEAPDARRARLPDGAAVRQLRCCKASGVLATLLLLAALVTGCLHVFADVPGASGWHSVSVWLAIPAMIIHAALCAARRQGREVSIHILP